MGELLNVKPKSQLFPIPMVMGCEGTASSMLLNFYNKDINATTIMSKWPTHSDNPEKVCRQSFSNQIWPSPNYFSKCTCRISK